MAKYKLIKIPARSTDEKSKEDMIQDIIDVSKPKNIIPFEIKGEYYFIFEL